MLPQLGSFDQICSHRIAFHISAHCQEVFIVFDGKALETRLVQMSFACGAVVSVIALGVRGGDPTQHLSHLPVAVGAKYEMPVVWHQDVGVDLHFVAFQSLAQHTLEGRVVFGLVENLLLGIPAIQRMVDPAGHIQTFLSRHHAHL